MHAVHSTRVADPCKPVPARRPFASIDHDVAADPRLSPTDLAVLVALLFWARSKDHCWPSDRSIGLRIGRSIPTVQRRLRYLESLGLVERVETTTNRTGRIIRLAWKSAPVPAPVLEPVRLRSVPAGPGPGPGPVGPSAAEVRDKPPRSSMIDPPRSSVIDEVRRSVQAEALKTPETEPAQRQRSEEAPAARPIPSPAPIVAEALGSTVPSSTPRPKISSTGSTTPAASPATIAARAQVLEWAESSDPILRAEAARRLRPRPTPRPEPQTTAELLARIQENPAHVAAAAEVLARTFDDRRSWAGFHAVARRAFEGEIPPGVLVDALGRASDPKARNPGAVFMSIVGRSSRSG